MSAHAQTEWIVERHILIVQTSQQYFIYAKYISGQQLLIRYSGRNYCYTCIYARYILQSGVSLGIYFQDIAHTKHLVSLHSSNIQYQQEN